MIRYLLVLNALIALTGCDLLESGSDHNPMTVSGTVVFDETGAPLAGISATIVFISPPGIVGVEATTRTDANGQFSVTYDPPEQTGAMPRGGYSLGINTYPYDSYDRRYTTSGNGILNPGTTRDLGTVVLSRNPNLP